MLLSDLANVKQGTISEIVCTSCLVRLENWKDMFGLRKWGRIRKARRNARSFTGFLTCSLATKEVDRPVSILTYTGETYCMILAAH